MHIFRAKNRDRRAAKLLFSPVWLLLLSELIIILTGRPLTIYRVLYLHTHIYIYVSVCVCVCTEMHGNWELFMHIDAKRVRNATVVFFFFFENAFDDDDKECLRVCSNVGLTTNN